MLQGSMRSVELSLNAHSMQTLLAAELAVVP